MSDVMRSFLFIFCVFVTSACGGRVSRPIELVQSIDPQLSCLHLEAEHGNNRKRMSELLGERSDQMRDNMGWIVASPLFLDLKDTEKKEAKALVDRNARLVSLAKEKSCALVSNGETSALQK
jgi:hypothetical protein